MSKKRLSQTMRGWIETKAAMQTAAMEKREIAQADLRVMSSLYYAPYRMTDTLSRVNPQTSLALSSVWCAINRISADLASMDLSLYQREDNGGRRLISEQEHPTSKALKITPDGVRSSYKWKQLTSAWVLGWGNAHNEIEYNRKGQTIGLHPIHPTRIRVEFDGGKLLYIVDNGSKVLSPDTVLHLYGFSTTGIEGISPIRANAMSVALGLQTTALSVSIHEKSSTPNGFIRVPGTLNADQQKQLRENISGAHEGVERAGKFGILTGGMEWINAPAISPADQQLIESKRFSISDIARIYSMPMSKLQELTNAHYANMEESNLDYLVTTLRSWVCCYEADYNWKLLTDSDRAKGYFIAYNMASFLRGNLEAMSRYYAMAIASGWMNQDEVRSELNLSKIEGGDQYWIQRNMMRLIDAGNIQPASPDGTATIKPLVDPMEPSKPAQKPVKNSMPHRNGLVPV